MESLERAKKTNQEDLKHLHETIAKQWHHLAEVIEKGRGSWRSDSTCSQVIPTPEAKTDPMPDIPNALRTGPMQGSDYGGLEVSSDLEKTERLEGTFENHLGLWRLSSNVDVSQKSDHQMSGIGDGDANERWGAGCCEPRSLPFGDRSYHRAHQPGFRAARRPGRGDGPQ